MYGEKQTEQKTTTSLQGDQMMVEGFHFLTGFKWFVIKQGTLTELPIMNRNMID
jgi:hypothetical protein